MPRDDLGVREEVTASQDIPHNHPAVEGGLVGWAAKSSQLDRWTRPDSEEATTIAEGELYVLFIGGKHELPIGTGNAPAGTVVGDKLYIDPDDNSVHRGVPTEGMLPLGVVTEVDAARTPDVALINTNAWQAFLPVPAEEA